MTRTFWRGELFWHGELMHHEAMDVVYLVTSPLFCSASAWATLRRRGNGLPVPVAAPCWLAVLLALGACFTASVAWQYPDNSRYPTADYPFFTSGRHVNGVIAPFIVLYVDGLRVLLERFGRSARWFALAALVTAISVSELLLMGPVFESSYNWWHR